MKSLSTRVVVVTGGADGIGRAVALEAVKREMKIVLADKREGRLRETAAELEALGAQVLAVPTDVTDPDSVESLADAAYERFGAVHLLINNAGVGYANSAWDTPLEEYERVIDVNLFGVIHSVRAFVPRMLAQTDEGHVVNIASAAGLLTVAGLGAYCASKFAVVGFSEALYHDLRERETAIGVTLVCPSWVKTSLVLREGDGDRCKVDAQAEAARSALTKAVNEGISPALVATSVFDAVLADRFYVLTHEATKAGFSVRAADLVAGRAPRAF